MNMKKIMAVCLAGTLSASLLAGCGKKESTTTTDGKVKLTYWKSLNVNTAGVVSNLGETEFAKKWQELGNVEVEFLHPPTGQANEKFSVLTASGKMPDIIEHDWTAGYTGGPGSAIKDGVLVNLGEYKKYAPNLFKYLGLPENDMKNRLCQTDEGEYFGFPKVMTDPRLAVSSGPAIRYDWLEDIGLPVPETIDEWTTAMRAFRDQKGAPAAYQLLKDCYPFAYAYGISPTFYIDDGMIKYGKAEEGFKKCLELLNGWYHEGIISKEFSTLDSKSRDYAILNGQSGAAMLSMGGGIGRYMSAATDKNFKLGAAPFPVLNKGDIREHGLVQTEISKTFAAITTSCKNVEAAMKFLDMAYEPDSEAYMLCNFGIEGVSYEMAEGYPKYTDYILNNPDGKSVVEAMSMYLTSFTSGPYLQDYRYFEQYAQLPVQKEAIEIWSDSNAGAHNVPYLYAKSDELGELARLSNDVETYADEMTLKFIMGVEPIEKFDNYVATLKQRGLDRLIEIKQQSLNRFNSK
jgi:putative aldouronate transport system substrate-binding protein